MTEERSTSASNAARAGGFNLREVQVGATVRLVDGATAAVVDNPRDGMWLLCRFLLSPDDPGRAGVTEPVFVHDVAEVLSSG
jgi:hypothetical protein